MIVVYSGGTAESMFTALLGVLLITLVVFLAIGGLARVTLGP